MAHDDIGGLQGVGREPFCAEYHNAQCRLFEHECVVAPIADRDDPIRAKAPYIFAFGECLSGSWHADNFHRAISQMFARMPTAVRRTTTSR